MSFIRRHQGLLTHYFVEKDLERGLSYAYGLRREEGLPLHLVMTAPIVRFDRKTDRFFTHYGVYSVGELITDQEEKELYRRVFAESELHFLDDFVASVPLSTSLH